MLYATIKLYGRNGNKGDFRAYEVKALKLFRKYGGEVVVAYVPKRDDAVADFPDEIQVLKISGPAEFEQFLKDPDRMAMSEERERLIRRAEVYLSEQIIQY